MVLFLSQPDKFAILHHFNIFFRNYPKQINYFID